MNITVRNNLSKDPWRRGYGSITELNDNMNIVVVNSIFRGLMGIAGGRDAPAIWRNQGMMLRMPAELCAGIRGNTATGGLGPGKGILGCVCPRWVVVISSGCGI